MSDRVYLDWNATAPLRPEARTAMIAAIDVVGNPSSVHAEGRGAKMIVEKAREQVAALVGCAPVQVVFTSGATEAAMLGLKDMDCCASDAEHDCVAAWTDLGLAVDGDGVIELTGGAATRQVANSETGVIQSQAVHIPFEDAVQAVGKIAYDFASSLADSAAVSSHKLGGPKGSGAFVATHPDETVFKIVGGGQEKGVRSGTLNVIGIAGFGAAAEAAQRDLDAGVWEPVADLRDDLEAALYDCAGDDLTIFGENAPRLPNTSCFAIPGWRGETQVMQLDLAGFAISAGSACSSGKVGPSRVLKAMGFDDITASSAIRVSMGPTTTKEEVSRFIDAWTALYRRMKMRAA